MVQIKNLKLIADTHVHSIVSGHAYTTILENAAAAKEKEIPILCCTDHSPELAGAPIDYYFGNLPRVLPTEYDGVRLLPGVELNIMDHKGTIDLEEKWLEPLDWVIASFHSPCIAPATKKLHTETWLAIAENPLIHVIGHCGDERYKSDYETVVKAFAEHGKIVEINVNSFETRPNSLENCTEIARLCKEYGVPIVVSSDAHFSTLIGEVQPALDMLDDIEFPEKLILNADYERFARMVNKINNRPVFPEYSV